MAFLEKQLVIKESTLPNAGKGLFTTKFIPKGERIVEYKGKITTWKEAKKNKDNGYIFHITDKHVIDALTYKKALARYANDAAGIARIKGVTNNSEYINDEDRIYIEAKRDIPAGSEIFVGYGKDYWDVMRVNWKKDKEKAEKAKAKKKAGK